MVNYAVSQNAFYRFCFAREVHTHLLCACGESPVARMGGSTLVHVSFRSDGEGGLTKPLHEAAPTENNNLYTTIVRFFLSWFRTGVRKHRPPCGRGGHQGYGHAAGGCLRERMPGGGLHCQRVRVVLCPTLVDATIEAAFLHYKWLPACFYLGHLV